MDGAVGEKGQSGLGGRAGQPGPPVSSSYPQHGIQSAILSCYCILMEASIIHVYMYRLPGNYNIIILYVVVVCT